jgi:hypothetical protein
MEEKQLDNEKFEKLSIAIKEAVSSIFTTEEQNEIADIIIHYEQLSVNASPVIVGISVKTYN